MQRETVLEKLLQMIQKRAEGKDMDLTQMGYDSNLSQYGFDSLDFSEIIVSVEDEFECVIRMDQLLQLKTINDFADFIISEKER